MTWPPPQDPYSGAPSGRPAQQPPMTGPTEPPPWQAASPIPSYVPPPPGAAQPGPQDGVMPHYAVQQPVQQQPAPAPAPASNLSPQIRYADWGERVAATFVDWLLAFIPAMVVMGIDDDLGALVFLAATAWIAWLNGSKGQSPGKALMGLRVVRDSDGSTLGGPVGLLRAFVLFMMFGITGGVLGVVAVLCPFWTQKKQALHDKIVSSSVVAGYPKAKLGKDLFKP